MLQPDFELLWGQNKEKSKSQRLFVERKARMSGSKIEKFL